MYRGNHILLIGSLLTALMASLAAADQDWPSWMGPHGTRAADSGMALVDDDAQAKLLWTSEAEFPRIYADPSKPLEFPISQYCTPVVANGLVYYVYPDPSIASPVDEILIEKMKKKQKSWKPKLLPALERACRLFADDCIVCMDAQTGETKWERRFEAKGSNSTFNTTYFASPIVDSGRLYVRGSMCAVYCLDAKTGETIWESELPDARAYWTELFDAWIEGPYADTVAQLKSGALAAYKEHRTLDDLHTASPLLIGDVLICTDSGTSNFTHQKKPLLTRKGAHAVVALDANTGKQLWRNPCGAQGGLQPWITKEGSYVVGARGSVWGFVCVDAANGSVLWNSPKNTPSSGYGTHLIAGNYLIQSDRKKGTTAYHLSTTGMEQAWHIDAGGNYSTPAFYKDHVFIHVNFSNATRPRLLACVELASGKVVKTAEVLFGNVCNSVIISDDRLWFGWEDYMIADPTSPDLFKQLGTKKRLPGPLSRNGWASPSVAGGLVFFRQGRGNRIHCVDYRK